MIPKTGSHQGTCIHNRVHPTRVRPLQDWKASPGRFFFWILKSKVAAYDMDIEMDKYEGNQNMNKFGHEWYP